MDTVWQRRDCGTVRVNTLPCFSFLMDLLTTNP